MGGIVAHLSQTPFGELLPYPLDQTAFDLDELIVGGLLGGLQTVAKIAVEKGLLESDDEQARRTSEAAEIEEVTGGGNQQGVVFRKRLSQGREARLIGDGHDRTP